MKYLRGRCVKNRVKERVAISHSFTHSLVFDVVCTAYTLLYTHRLEVHVFHSDGRKSATFLWFKHHCLKMRQYLLLIEIIKQQIKAIICWGVQNTYIYKHIFGVDAHLFLFLLLFEGYVCNCVCVTVRDIEK